MTLWYLSRSKNCRMTSPSSLAVPGPEKVIGLPSSMITATKYRLAEILQCWRRASSICYLFINVSG